MQRVGCAVVVVGGPAAAPTAFQGLPKIALVVAADSGLTNAWNAGLHVDVVVGDLDSVVASALEKARADGVEVVEHPADKDQLDLELALAEALRRGVAEILVIGSAGGRLDHVLANAAMLAAADWHDVAVSARFDSAQITVVHPHRPASVSGTPGDVVSLLVVGPGCTGVTTRGLRWELAAADLVATSGFSASNELAASAAEISIASGALLVVQPGPA